MSVDTIICGRAEEYLLQINDNSVDLVLTDPPYFLDKLDNSWDVETVSKKSPRGVVHSLPPGMKFSRQQGEALYAWYLEISRQIYRILKPGGFFFSFSSPRLYHRMACAVDDAGFEVRDCLMWVYTRSQVKAMGLNHFLDKSETDDKEKIRERLSGWKTPQLKSVWEPIVMAKKPNEGTFLENFLKYGTGLINTESKTQHGYFPSNLVATEEIDPVIDRYFLIEKPSRQDKGENNFHCTVKPLSLCEHLIRLTTVNGALVLDPFAGSGTTLVAAQRLGRHYLGIEINRQYVEIAQQRLRVEQETALLR